MSSWTSRHAQQDVASRYLPQNLNLSTKVTAGGWHQFETHMKLNDIGQRERALGVVARRRPDRQLHRRDVSHRPPLRPASGVADWTQSGVVGRHGEVADGQPLARPHVPERRVPAADRRAATRIRGPVCDPRHCRRLPYTKGGPGTCYPPEIDSSLFGRTTTERNRAAQSKPVERRRRRVTGLQRTLRHARRAASQTDLNIGRRAGGPFSSERAPIRSQGSRGSCSEQTRRKTATQSHGATADTPRCPPGRQQPDRGTVGTLAALFLWRQESEVSGSRSNAAQPVAVAVRTLRSGAGRSRRRRDQVQGGSVRYCITGALIRAKPSKDGDAESRG